jgi:hypothetical protein
MFFGDGFWLLQPGDRLPHQRGQCHHRPGENASYLSVRGRIEAGHDEEISCMGTATSSWSNSKTYFKYAKLVLMFFHQIF